jgi:hypothetical protein
MLMIIQFSSQPFPYYPILSHAILYNTTFLTLCQPINHGTCKKTEINFSQLKYFVIQHKINCLISTGPPHSHYFCDFEKYWTYTPLVFTSTATTSSQW